MDGQETQGQWPAIIDRATYDQIQRPAREASTRTYTKLNPAFPLKSLVRCACGRKLTSDATMRGKRPKYREYYRCPVTGPEHVNIRPNDLHGPFLDLLARLTPAPGFDPDEIRAALASRRERVQRDLRAERTRLAAIEQDQRQATDRYIKAPSAVVDDALAARLAELKDQHATIAAKITELEDEQRQERADEQRTIERINVAMADLPQAWADGSLQVRQAIVKLAFPEGDRGRGQAGRHSGNSNTRLARNVPAEFANSGRRPAWRPQADTTTCTRRRRSSGSPRDFRRRRQSRRFVNGSSRGALR